MSRNEGLTEISDSAQARWKLDLDSVGRWEVDRVVWMKPEPYSLVGDVIAGEAFLKQFARGAEQLDVQPPDDYTAQWPGLIPSDRRSVWFDDKAPFGIEPDGKTVAPKPVYRDRDIHMLQECS